MKRILWSFSGLLVVATLLYFGSSPFARYLIERNFETISLEERVAGFVEASALALRRIDEADFAISAAPETLQKAFNETIDKALIELTSNPVDGLGLIEVTERALALSFEPMNAAVRGRLSVALADRELGVTADVDIRLFARFERGRIVYVPFLSEIEVKELESRKLDWWPFDLSALASRVLEASLESLNGAISERAIEVPGLASLENAEHFSFEVLGREVAVQVPTLGDAAFLIDSKGIVAIGEIIPVGSNPIAVNAEAADDFKNYRNTFLEKIRGATTQVVPGTDSFWVAASALTGLAVDDLSPVTAEEAIASLLGTAKVQLAKMHGPTLAFGVDAKTVQEVLARALAMSEGHKNKPGQSFRFARPPSFELGEGAITLSAPILLSQEGVTIEATLNGIIGAALNGRELRVTAAIADVIFEQVRLGDTHAEGWPAEVVARMARSFVTSALPALNSLLSEYPIELPIEPLSIAGTPPETVDLTVADREVTLYGPMVESWATLIHPGGIALVAQVIPYNPDASGPLDPPEGQTAEFSEVLALFKLRAKSVDPSFDISQSDFRLSEDMLQAWLSPVGAAFDRNKAHAQAIGQSHRELLNLTGPDLAVSIPLSRLREIAFQEVEGQVEKLAEDGLIVDPAQVELTFAEQALGIAFAFRYEAEGLEIVGQAEGDIFAGYAESGPTLQPYVRRVKIENLVVEAADLIDLSKFAGSVSHLVDQLLPILNSSLNAIDIDIAEFDEFKVDLAKNAGKIEGLRITPEQVTIPAPHALRPILLIDRDRVALVADLNAAYLSVRPEMDGHIPGGADPTVVYAAFRADFQRAWERAFDWPPSDDALQAELASARIAETLENLWSSAALKIDVNRQESTSSSRQPAAAIPPNPSCGELCKKPSCDRNKTCPPRSQCEDVSRTVTEPTTVAKEVCEPVEETITEPVKKTREVCKDVTKRIGGVVGRVIKDTVCKTVEFTEHVEKTVTKEVCNTVEVVEDVQRDIIEEVCKEVADTACLASLDKCTAKWKAYDLCSVPFTACSKKLQGVTKTLEAFDFDKFGYVSTSASVDISATVDAAVPLEIADDLKNASVAPYLSGQTVVNVTVDFEPRASALVACTPVEPFRLSNYRLGMDPQTPRLEATIFEATEAERDDDPATLDLSIALAPINLSGDFPMPPLTQLLLDTPSTIVTCPLVGTLAAGLQISGSTSLTRDSITGAVRQISNDDRVPEHIARLLLDGKVVYEIEVPTPTFRIPSFSIQIAGKNLEFTPEISGKSIRLTH